MEFHYNDIKSHQSNKNILLLMKKMYNIELKHAYSDINFKGLRIKTFLPLNMEPINNKKVFSVSLFKILTASTNKFGYYISGIMDSIVNVLTNFPDYRIMLYTDISLLCKKSIGPSFDAIKSLFELISVSKCLELCFYDLEDYITSINYVCDNDLIINKAHKDTIGTIFRFFPFYISGINECHIRDTDSTFGNTQEKLYINTWLQSNDKSYYVYKGNYLPSHYHRDKSAFEYAIIANGFGGRLRKSGMNITNKLINKCIFDHIETGEGNINYDIILEWINGSNEYFINKPNYGIDEVFLNEYMLHYISQSEISIFTITMPASIYPQLYINNKNSISISDNTDAWPLINILNLLMKIYGIYENLNEEEYYGLTALMDSLLILSLVYFSVDKNKFISLFNEIMARIKYQTNIYYTLDVFESYMEKLIEFTMKSKTDNIGNDAKTDTILHYQNLFNELKSIFIKKHKFTDMDQKLYGNEKDVNNDNILIAKRMFHSLYYFTVMPFSKKFYIDVFEKIKNINLVKKLNELNIRNIFPIDYVNDFSGPYNQLNRSFTVLNIIDNMNISYLLTYVGVGKHNNTLIYPESKYNFKNIIPDYVKTPYINFPIWEYQPSYTNMIYYCITKKIPGITIEQYIENSNSKKEHLLKFTKKILDIMGYFWNHYVNMDINKETIFIDNDGEPHISSYYYITKINDEYETLPGKMLYPITGVINDMEDIINTSNLKNVCRTSPRIIVNSYFDVYGIIKMFSEISSKHGLYDQETLNKLVQKCEEEKLLSIAQNEEEFEQNDDMITCFNSVYTVDKSNQTLAYFKDNFLSHDQNGGLYINKYKLHKYDYLKLFMI